MPQPRRLLFAGLALVSAGLLNAQDSQDVGYSDPDCPFLGPQAERYYTDAYRRKMGIPERRLTQTTHAVTSAMGFVPGGSRTYNYGVSHKPGSIDSYIYADFQANGITPAPRTTDWEFIRRVTLDLTGRIPTADRVLSFVADASPDKRAKLVDELLAKPEWIDKWTMYYGDLFKNASRFPSSGVAQNVQGRDAFNKWIRDSLTNAKPYNKMASELIGSTGTDNTTQGELNWMNNGRVANVNLRQDDWDQQTANVADTFLGIAHV